MNYQKRIKWAFGVSAAVHLALLMLPAEWRRAGDAIGPATVSDPIIVNLQPWDKPVSLVDVVVPADQPVSPDTNLIATQDSNAADDSAVEGERLAPYFEEPDEFDQMPTPSEAEAPEPIIATAPNVREAVQSPPQALPGPEEELDAGDIEAVADPAPVVEKEKLEPEQEDMQLAKADLAAVPDVTDHEALGRPDGGAKNKGFVAFEAKEDEFAEYLKEVQGRVERRWKAMIQIRYSGSQGTKAKLDCTINPRGQLVGVKIVEPGSSPSFAPLCKEAVESAGPFPPFPFSVPKMYRTENLEIRWTFSFLRR